MNKQEQETTETKKESSIELHSVRIPYWLTEKAQEELSSWEQLVVYCWIYDHNGFAIRKGGNIYGKHTYETYHLEITRDLRIKRPDVVIDKLKKAKWIAESYAAPFKGQSMKGYRCLLDSKQRVEVKAEQQELQLADEENETVIESSKPAPEEDNLKKIYRYGGQYWYEENGEKVYIPQSVADDVYRLKIPPHWVYDFEADRWCAPEDVTVRELEF